MIAFNHRRRSIKITAAVVYDAATTAYMNAAGIPNNAGGYYAAPYATTGMAMWNAADALIAGLKSNGLWARIHLLYPALGGTAASHAVNAKAPGSQTLAYSLNQPTHNAQGLRFNGVNQLANSQYAISNMPTGQGYALDYYSADNTAGSASDPIEMGAFSGADGLFLFVKNPGAGSKAGGRASATALRVDSTNTVADSRGLFTVDRDAAGVGSLYRNAVSIATPVSLGGVPANSTVGIAIGATGGDYGYTDRGCSLACVRGSFTAAETTTYYNLIQAFQTANFRNV